MGPRCRKRRRVGSAEALGAKVTGFHAAPDLVATLAYGEIAPYIPLPEPEKATQKVQDDALRLPRERQGVFLK